MFRVCQDVEPRRMTQPGLAVGLLVLTSVFFPCIASAQVLRIGPFDFTAKARVGAVWSDNIEAQRPSAQTEEPVDYYGYYGLDLRSDAQLSGEGRVALATGFTVEKHVVRDDLDNSDSPLGYFRAEAIKKYRRLTLDADYSWERKSSSADIVIPGVSGKTRNPQETREYGWGGNWAGYRVTLDADYEMTQDRYEKEEFREGDRNSETLTYLAAWRVIRQLNLEYEVEYTRDEEVNDPDAPSEWEATETFRLNFDELFNLWRHPKVTFSVGVEREDERDNKGEWEPIYEITVSDVWDISSRLKLNYRAGYTYEDKYEEDDIAFTYNVALEHEINARTIQRLSLVREPRRTFGSTTDSDTTTWQYGITFNDFLIPNLRLGGAVTYDITIPPGEDANHVWGYSVNLAHAREVTSRLRRTLVYSYDAEDSDLESEWLVENRVELNYVYDF